MNLNDIIKEEIDRFIGENQFAYHVTRRKNLPSIQKTGLEPKVPEDFGLVGDKRGVYLFKTYDDMVNGLYNWLGMRIEDWEETHGEEYDEIGLKIDMNKINPDSIEDSVDYEWIVTETIQPEAIIELIEI